MAKMSDYFSGNYFNAKSLLDGNLILTISYCEGRTFEAREKGKNDEQKMVVFFEEDERGLALNVTNWNSITEIIGNEDTDTWPGHQILLVRKKDRGVGGQMDWCVRVEAVPQAAAAPARQQPATRSAPPQRGAASQPRRMPQATERQYQEVDEDPVPF